jgi:excisionase family DNA binding protein
MEMAKIFYTPAAAARILRVSERTVKEHLRRGRLHGVKVGKLWRIPAAALSALERPSVRAAESSSLEIINDHIRETPETSPYGRSWSGMLN